MLHFIKDITDPLIAYIKDDPVRPEIPVEFRVSKNTEIIALVENDKPSAIVCVAYRDFVPKDCDDLLVETDNPFIAVFYTIWSYAPGAGRDLIIKARTRLAEIKPEINKYVTLSPQTEMAKRFHLKNGASIFRHNNTSVNYEYA